MCNNKTAFRNKPSYNFILSCPKGKKAQAVPEAEDSSAKGHVVSGDLSRDVIEETSEVRRWRRKNFPMKEVTIYKQKLIILNT